MKIILRLSTLLFVNLLAAQQPAIGNMTMIPTAITPNTPLKIVTTVTTPAQGVLVDQSFSVTQNPNVIELRICYGSGLLPATFAYVDTFNVGLLPAGTYSVHFRAYMSSANQWCNKIDSNEVNATLSVNVTTGLINLNDLKQSVYVTEGGAKLVYHCDGETTIINIYKMNGLPENSFQVSGSGSVDLQHLSAGIYLLRYEEKGKQRTVKFIKE